MIVSSEALDPRCAQAPPGVGPPHGLRDVLLQRLAPGKIELPPLPQVASQVLALAGDPEADAVRLAALVHRDPALAGHVLRIANSPAYLPRSPIVSLQQAVTRLGVDALIEIAVAACLQGGVLQAPGFEAELAQVWRHSVASAAYAKEIARVKRVNVEGAYLCGLMHEIGKPLVLRALSDFVQDGSGRPEPAVLAGLVDDLHETAGRQLADRWGLPRSVVLALTYCSHYDEADACTGEAMLTCLADHLASWALLPETPDRPPPGEHRVFADMNLYPDDIEALLEKAEIVRAVADSMVS